MALGGISVTLDVNTPSGTSLAGTADDDIRSLKTTLNQVLDSEHIFGSTGGSNVGAHRKGSAVAFYGASSAISSTDTNGRLMVTSDTSRLHHMGSDSTIFLGGRYAVESAPAVNLNSSLQSSTITQVMAMETGTGIMLNGSTTTTITLRNTYVVGVAQLTSQLNGGFPGSGSIPVTTGVSGNQLVVYNMSAAGANSSSSVTYVVAYLVAGFKAL